jgi:hypothetical protein
LIEELQGKMPERLQAYWDHNVKRGRFVPLPAAKLD